MKKNIVLVGIMGCGKTSIGLSLSYKLKMPVIDMDKEIEKQEKMLISEIFAKYGEEYFRNVETQTAKKLSKLDGYIISTGGGVVLKGENMEYLKNNGIIVYIHRTPDEIVKSVNTENRPLLKDGPQKLFDIYNARHNTYLKYADVVVNNSGSFTEGVENVYSAVKDIIQN